MQNLLAPQIDLVLQPIFSYLHPKMQSLFHIIQNARFYKILHLTALSETLSILLKNAQQMILYHAHIAHIRNNRMMKYMNFTANYSELKLALTTFQLLFLLLFFSHGLCAQSRTLLPVRQGEHLIFYQTDGIEKFRVEGYKFASKKELDFDCFQDGLCALTKGKYKDDHFEFHYIDTLGNIQIDLGNNMGKRFSEGLAQVYDKSNKSYHFINVKGEKIFETSGSADSHFMDGMIIIQNAMEDSLSYLDQTGTVLFKRSRKNTTSARDKTGFVDGLAIFKTILFTQGYSYINKKGKVVIEGNHKNPQRFSEGLAAVEIDNSTLGFIDTSGDLAFSIRSKENRSFSDELVAIKSSYKWGFVNKVGEWDILPEFKQVQDFKDGYAAVRDELYWIIVDKLGRVVFQDYSVNYMQYVGDNIVFVNYYGENNYAYIKFDKSLSIKPNPEYVQFTSYQEAEKYPLESIRSFNIHPYNNQVGQKVWKRNSYFRLLDKQRTFSDIDEFPSELLKFTNLRKLDLSSNRLSDISPEICKLLNLEELNLSDNGFVKFPNSLHCLKNLKTIDLSSTQINTLPDEDLVFKNVDYLDLFGTPLAKNPTLSKKLKLYFPNAKIILSIDDVVIDK